ncbi:MAG: hypothetical protein IMZ64_05250 [Bacteroidetes bacterium]|nr:hypothetical protein [Bacteroidota bacterium]
MKKLTRNQIMDLVDMALNACIIRPKGDPDGAHRYAAACCIKILTAEGYKIDKVTMRLMRVDTPVGKHDFLKEVTNNFNERND